MGKELSNTAQQMEFPIKDFFIKCNQILSFLQIWSHLLKKPLMENFIFLQCKKKLELKVSGKHLQENTVQAQKLFEEEIHSFEYFFSFSFSSPGFMQKSYYINHYNDYLEPTPNPIIVTAQKNEVFR